MKILHIISSLSSGGAEIYVRDLAAQMVQDGHDVCIAYVSDATSLGRSYDFQEDFKAQLDHKGVRYEKVGHSCRRWLWRGGMRLRQIFKEFRPDIIHTHLYYGVFFTAFAHSGIPVVYTHHNHRLGKGKYLYPILNKIVNQYVGISRDCAKVLCSAGAKDVATIYNAVNVDRLLVKESWEDKDTVQLISVGLLSPQKNFTLLINAMDTLYKRRRDLKRKVLLLIAGEGPLKDVVQQQIDSVGLSKQIILLGNRNDIPQLLHNADVFTLSSDWEGLPIALLEAMMTGLPSVVTDVGGCRDVVEDCSAGIVVPPGDAEALANALERMVSDASLREKYGKNSLVNAKKFSIANATSEHLSLYEKVLSYNGTG
ncbi:MAG: glycosyltransferase [Anaerolineales bacterium]|nr:glycosyltransferase [Anaerolineales bacterium]